MNNIYQENKHCEYWYNNKLQLTEILVVIVSERQTFYEHYEQLKDKLIDKCLLFSTKTPIKD